MSERKFTFVEYHSHGAGPSFFPGLNPLTETGSDASSESIESDENDDDSSRMGLALLIGLVALIGFGLAIKYFRGESSDEIATFEHEDVQVTEYED